MKIPTRPFLPLLVALGVLACTEKDKTITKVAGELETVTSQPNKSMQEITGEVFYRERMMLPPSSRLTVTLEDVSKMDVASELITSKVYPIESAPPFTYTLVYDPKDILPKHRYSLRATITVDDQLLMTSTQNLDPFLEADNIPKIMLRSVARSPKTAKQTPDTGLEVISVNPLVELTNTYWKLTNIYGDEPVMREGQKREMYLQLVSENQSIKGFCGCNEVMGTYENLGNSLSFEKVGTTRKLCPNVMDLEALYLKVLEETAYYSINEHALTLLNVEKKPIARYQARHMQ